MGYLYYNNRSRRLMRIPKIRPSQSSRIYSFQLKTMDMMATMIFAKMRSEATNVLICMISLLLFSKYSTLRFGSLILKVMLDSMCS